MPPLPPPAALSAAAWGDLAEQFEGELRLDDVALAIYSTDASEYQERPRAVALPKTEADVALLVRFAAAHRLPPGR